MNGSRDTVGVVLVNWNNARLTVDCVDSLRLGTRMPDSIVIVDNGSAPGDLIRLRALPGVELLPQSENLGFTGANNLGLSELLARGMEYVWILNNDTVVAKECLEHLLAALERHPDVGAMTGLIYFADQPDSIWFAGGYFHSMTLTAHHRGVFESDRGQFERAEDIAFMSGCCMLVRARTLRRLGGFHPAFFAYWEDTEWCLRAREQNVRLRYEPTAKLWHKVSPSLKQNIQSGFYERLSFRNWIYTLRLHAHFWQWPIALAAVLRYALIRTFHAWRQGEKSVPTSIWAGLCAGFRTSLSSVPPLIVSHRI